MIKTVSRGSGELVIKGEALSLPLSSVLLGVCCLPSPHTAVPVMLQFPLSADSEDSFPTQVPRIDSFKLYFRFRNTLRA